MKRTKELKDDRKMNKMKEDRPKHVDEGRKEETRNEFQQLQAGPRARAPAFSTKFIDAFHSMLLNTHRFRMRYRYAPRCWSDASVVTNCVTSLCCTADNELLPLLRTTGSTHSVTERGIAAVTTEIQREISYFVSPSFDVFSSFSYPFHAFISSLPILLDETMNYVTYLLSIWHRVWA
jgi:hypothetical protein